MESHVVSITCITIKYPYFFSFNENRISKIRYSINRSQLLSYLLVTASFIRQIVFK